MTYKIDLRSDTVTTPCAGMRKAMAEATVGDSMFGEDPTVNAFESKIAELFNCEKALFVPTGTMSNQIAIGTLTSPGETILCEDLSHFYLYESGATSSLSGVQFETVAEFSGQEVCSKIRTNPLYHAKTSLFIFENTHNEKGGGARSSSQTSANLGLIKQSAPGLFTHLDGARLWNAAVACGDSLSDLSKGFDTVSVCMSKGLGAPVGSVLLLKDKETYEFAQHYRKRLGGAMRQAGILAAACDFAMSHNFDRLAEDHEKRALLSEYLVEGGFEQKDIKTPTNMIYFKHRESPSQMVIDRLIEQGIGCFLLSGGYIRFVTHKDVSFEQIKSCREKILRAAERP